MFLQNKKSLFIWTILLGILSFFVFIFLIHYVLGPLSYPQLSSEARQVTNEMDNVKQGIGKFANRNIGNVQYYDQYGRYTYSYDGVNCSSNDTLKSACNNLEKLTGMKPQIFSKDHNFCAFIKYDRGFYRANSKYLCKDHNSNSYSGDCDESEVVCRELKADGVAPEMFILFLIISAFSIIFISFIVLLVKTFFRDWKEGLCVILLIVIAAIIIYALYFRRF